MLAGRYLLHGAIGTGASGRVYVADDTRLRRRVAVKVLHAALAEDAAFLRRFRAEAQLAASLHHPHIVTVHDWGEDDVPFMVLELLEGGSLRAMLDAGTRLSVAQAARVGRDVASALEYAHARGVLHRDIKPANLLFDEHGIVRVADFGLARALAEASWTEPAGAVFGTARYASPEQAQGSQLDGRSDLYSLALVLVEGVTGAVPFTADTTLGLLTARTQTPLTAPDAMGGLAPVIDRAGAIAPAERYPDAGTMRAALSDAADSLPPPAPIPVAGMVDGADPHPTRAVPVKTAALFDQDAIQVLPDDVTEPIVIAEAAPARSKRHDQGPGNPQRRLVPFMVAFFVLLTVAIAAGALARVGGATPLLVPGLVGDTNAEALDAARAAGFEIKQGAGRPAPEPVGYVVDQNPKPGDFTSSRKITVFLSTGPPKVAIPNIQGKSWEDAKKILNDAGLVPDANPSTTYNNLAPAGTVLDVRGAKIGDQLAQDSVVKVLLSRGHEPVVVDAAVVGKTYADASKLLTGLGFKVTRAPDDEFSSTIPRGRVARTEPEVGSNAPFGSEIVVHVSKGPDLVAVPNILNLKPSDAQDELDARGFSMAIAGRSKGNWRAVAQDPEPGKKAERGSTVTVEFANPNSSDSCFIFFTC
jgi:serine/threonine-protein kinase